MKKKCKFCIYYVANPKKQGFGTCHFNPPRIFLAQGQLQGQVTVMSFNTPTESENYCHECSFTPSAITGTEAYE